MTTYKQDRLDKIHQLEAEIAKLMQEINQFESLPENNVYASLDDACRLEDVLQHRAHEDCEGSYSCGAPEYTQDFMVDGLVYTEKLTVEYNRHDKTYYYIDNSDFSIEPKEAQ